MEPINFDAIDLIQKLKVTGVTNPSLLDAIYEVQNMFPKLDEKEVYAEAKLLQLLDPDVNSEVLIIGTHSITLYYILGKLVKKTYMYELKAQDILEKSREIRKHGYGNIVTANTIEANAPYAHIIIDTCQEEEPKEYIKLLAKTGSLIIKATENSNDLIKITNTNKGYIRENYSKIFLKY
ncbi:MAG: hypothetical protein ACOZAO_00440 [Patescibacteria group bacterium]